MKKQIVIQETKSKNLKELEKDLEKDQIKELEERCMVLGEINTKLLFENEGWRDKVKVLEEQIEQYENEYYYEEEYPNDDEVEYDSEANPYLEKEYKEEQEQLKLGESSNSEGFSNRINNE